MTLVRQAAASEIAVPSRAEHETWIDGYRAECWTAAGWISVVIMTCCILMGLVHGTHTLEEGRCAQDIPTRIMTTKQCKAAHCRSDRVVVLPAIQPKVRQSDWRRRIVI